MDNVRMQLIDNWSNCACVIGRGVSTAVWVIALKFFTSGSSCRAKPGRRGAIGEYQRSILTYTRRGNGRIAVAQSHQRSGLLTAGHYPQRAPGPVDNGEGQRHSTPALVGTAHGDIRLDDIENRVSRHQRWGVAVRSEAEMHEVEHRRRAGYS